MSFTSYDSRSYFVMSLLPLLQHTSTITHPHLYQSGILPTPQPLLYPDSHPLSIILLLLQVLTSFGSMTLVLQITCQAEQQIFLNLHPILVHLRFYSTMVMLFPFHILDHRVFLINLDI